MHMQSTKDAKLLAIPPLEQVPESGIGAPKHRTWRCALRAMIPKLPCLPSGSIRGLKPSAFSPRHNDNDTRPLTLIAAQPADHDQRVRGAFFSWAQGRDTCESRQPQTAKALPCHCRPHGANAFVWFVDVPPDIRSTIVVFQYYVQ
jgi:hypothetical protein